jgi:hypothetical protein
MAQMPPLDIAKAVPFDGGAAIDTFPALFIVTLVVPAVPSVRFPEAALLTITALPLPFCSMAKSWLPKVAPLACRDISLDFPVAPWRFITLNVDDEDDSTVPTEPAFIDNAAPLDGVGMTRLLGKLTVTAPVELETAISFAVPAIDVTPAIS